MSDSVDPVADPAAVVTHGPARFTVLNDGLLRLEWSAESKFEDRASYFVVNRRLPVPKFNVERVGDALKLTTSRIELHYRPNGKPFDRDNLQVDLLIPDFPPRPEAPPLRYRWNTGEPAPHNLLGTYRTLDGISGSSDMEPGMLTLAGWTFVDDSTRILFSNEEWPWATPRADSAALDWYLFVYGRDYPLALRDFISIGGRIPMPPRWAFGAWWSRYWAYSDAELRELVQQFESHGVPLDVLVVDMDWHLDGWTGYTFNPKYFPDADGFMKWCREKGLKVTLNLHPAEGVGKHEAAFGEYCKAVGQDPTKAERIQFSCISKEYMRPYFDLLHRPLEARGVDFWWIDWQQGKDSGMAGLDPLPWLNHLHWEDWTKNPARKNTRPILFSRWGGLGNHRYQVGFSGDTFCDWPSLAFQPYFTATAGNVGYAYWSHDIGGHQPGPVEPELYTRWIQWGVLSPILRTHTTKNPLAERRIWEFPPEYYGAMKAAWLLRYELIPYLYTTARQCYETGLPLCRPLYYRWPDRDAAYTYTHEYLLGDNLLCAPITSPRNSFTGCATAKVWIPPGEWVHWFTGQRFSGPCEVRVPTPLEQIPLFARAGSVIPTAERRTDTVAELLNERAYSKQPVAFHVFPGKSADSALYEDDGIAALDAGAGSTTFSLRTESSSAAISAEVVPSGSPAAAPTRRDFVFVFHDVDRPRAVTRAQGAAANRTSTPIEDFAYDPVARTCSLRVTDYDGRAPLAVMLTPPARQTGPQSTASQSISAILRGGENPAAADPAAIRKQLAIRLGVTTDFEYRQTPVPGLDLVLGVAPTDGADLPEVLTVTFSPNGAAPPYQAGGDKVVGVHRIPVAADRVADDGSEDSLPQTRVVTAEVRLVRRPDERAEAEGGNWRFRVPVSQSLLPSINGWWIAGPFEGVGSKELDKAMAGLSEVDASQTWPGKDSKPAKWHRVVREVNEATNLTSEFFVGFREVFGRRPDHACAYGVVFLDSPAAQPAQLALGSDDSVTVWLNGQQVHQKVVGRPYTSRSDFVPIDLRAGKNVLSLRIDQGTGDWGFGVHVETREGQALTNVITRLK